MMRTPRVQYLLGIGFVCLLIVIHLTVNFKDLTQDVHAYRINRKHIFQSTFHDELENGELLNIILEHRQQRMKRACEHNRERINRREIDVRDLKSLYVNDQYKLLYCEVPKIACTNWKRILLILSGKMNTTNPVELPSYLVHGEYAQNYLRTLTSYTSEEIEYRLKHYYKVIFVREPLERLLSAYKNKFMQTYNKYFHQRYGKVIIRRFRPNATNEALDSGENVTFPEFVKYLLDRRTTQLAPFNTHWQAYYKLCRPCLVQYDYIGKYETLEQDGNSILRELNVHHWLRFPASSNKGTKTADALKMFFSNISKENIHKLWQLYSVDYDMFGYQYPDMSRLK